MAALEVEHYLQEIDYLGCAYDLKDAQLGAIFIQGQIIVFKTMTI